jgi:hypothetical protein
MGACARHGFNFNLRSGVGWGRARVRGLACVRWESWLMRDPNNMGLWI